MKIEVWFGILLVGFFFLTVPHTLHHFMHQHEHAESLVYSYVGLIIAVVAAGCIIYKQKSEQAT